MRGHVACLTLSLCEEYCDACLCLQKQLSLLLAHSRLEAVNSTVLLELLQDMSAVLIHDQGGESSQPALVVIDIVWS